MIVIAVILYFVIGFLVSLGMFAYEKYNDIYVPHEDTSLLTGFVSFLWPIGLPTILLFVVHNFCTDKISDYIDRLKKNRRER